MQKTDIRNLDLNLLLALDALLRERNVTRAGRKLGLSQPATSRALGRLRQTFDDPLLVRSSGGLVSTPRAEALAAPLAHALAAVTDLMRSRPFDPATFQGRFNIVTPDYVALTLLPAVLSRLLVEAPDLDLRVGGWRPGLLADIEADTQDLGIGVFAGAPAGFYRQKLFSDDFVCVLRTGHLAAKGSLTIEHYLNLPHALISVTDEGPGAVDLALQQKGLARRVALRIPHFVAAPLVVAETDLILTLPRRLANRFADDSALVLREPPLDLPGFDVVLLWHERRHADPSHRWLRQVIAREAHKI